MPLARFLCQNLLFSLLALLLMATAITAPLAQTITQLPVSAADALARDLTFWEELAFWETVKDSTDLADLEAYLGEYPRGRFADLARVRAAVLRADGSTDSTPSPTTHSNIYIATVNANVRAAPTQRARRLAGLDAGQQVAVTGAVAGGLWYRVQLAEQRTGYVFAELLEPALTTTPMATTAPPTSPQPGDVWRDCDQCPPLVAIAAGDFTMGSQLHSNEGPPHPVHIDNAFALGVFELSVEQWRACTDAGDCREPPRQLANNTAAASQLPIAGISWDDAQTYLQWLRRISAKPYRLPSEAEWEYAARGGTGNRYWWGDQLLSNHANCRGCGSRWDGRSVAPSGAFPANPFGLYDTHGNLWEWTEDCWNDDYHDVPTRAAARLSGDCSARVMRGGGWQNDANEIRVARRLRQLRGERFHLAGLRVARDL